MYKSLAAIIRVTVMKVSNLLIIMVSKKTRLWQADPNEILLRLRFECVPALQARLVQSSTTFPV
jgi:hypothetical protein